MKKYFLFIFSLFLLSPLVFYSWFALTSGEHHYKRDDFFSYWLYTPDILKNTPLISKDAEYEYDLDEQRTLVVISWRHINDVAEKKTFLNDFLQQRGSSIKYDCLWIYHDPNDFSRNYQRYCVYQKSDTLELEFVETAK
ncbi:hypothetical protein KG902_000506 [Salmonella enterica]|nr:hypothetical protein [Salmonella enterica]EHM9013509.1 hypothetical protein [Salmonella enterica]EHM9102308.1 hypothetical protein [Salmonella enterica]EHM9338212.1 hypothetical protein [Salmonella enterica]EIE1633565.1 hypothetical protein [Salmonella enterica]